MAAARGVLRVLAYHAVAPLPVPRESPLWRYGIPAPEFLAHLDQLAQAGFSFVDAEGLLGWLEGRAALPRRAVLVTFDDCHESVEAAAVMMERRGIPGVAFAITQALDAPPPDFRGLQPPLDAGGLARLARHGLELGAHGHTHRRLTRLDRGELLAETAGAIARLQSACGGPVRLYAYPYGDHDRRVRDCVREAGARAAFTTDPGVVGHGADPFGLRRIEIFRGETGLAFRAKVETGGGLLRLRASIRLRSRLRRLSERRQP